MATDVRESFKRWLSELDINYENLLDLDEKVSFKAKYDQAHRSHEISANMAMGAKEAFKQWLLEIDVDYNTLTNDKRVSYRALCDQILPSVSPVSLAITGAAPENVLFAFRKAIQTTALQSYVSIGNSLKDKDSNSGLFIIEKGVAEFVESVPGSAEYTVVFAYLDGSSGLGKTQLAFALLRPVLYVPFGNSQLIYQCFRPIYDVIHHAVKADMVALRKSSTTFGEFSTAHIKEALRGEHKLKYLTVPVLLKLLELFATARADGSNVLLDEGVYRETNVFVGADCDFLLEGLTVMEGQRAAEKYREVLVFLDEIPPMDKARMTDFQEYLFLRNMVRCLVLPCLLSGTESTLLDVVEGVKGSRIAGRTEYAWLLAKFPNIQLDRLIVQSNRFGGYEQHLLSHSRPLFVQWCAESICSSPAASTVPAASQEDEPTMRVTPEALMDMKSKICIAKTFADEDDIKAWLHASTLLVFADSLAGSGEVAATVATECVLQVGEKRTASSFALSQPRKKQKVGNIRDNVKKHSLVIRKNFALLHIASELVDPATGMAKLFVGGGIVYNSDGSQFKIQAAFPTCAEDPLLYLACLRGGLLYRDVSAGLVQVPSSHAFTNFNVHTEIGNSQAPSNDGTGLEAECMAAVVLAAHRYTSFAGTPFLRWLSLVIAELSHLKEFKETPINGVPEELRAALQAVQVPLLSPPNCSWGEETVKSDINVANLIWCENKDRRDGYVPLPPPEGARSTHREEEEEEEEEEKEGKLEEEEEEEGTRGEAELTTGHDFTSLVLEIKDTKDNFGGDKIVAVTKRVPDGSVTVLICSHLAEWTEATKAKFAEDVSVYCVKVKKNKRFIERTSSDKWAPGRKLLIALDLSTLHPGRYETLLHST